VKVMFLCLTKYHIMKMYGGAFWTLALNVGEWSVSRPGRFIPG
jgi:hypothetical protein